MVRMIMLRVYATLLSLLSLLCASLPFALSAQPNAAYSNIRTKWISPTIQRQSLDSLTIYTPSFLLQTPEGHTLRQHLHYRLLNGVILELDTQRIRNDFPERHQLRASYRVLPYALHQSIQRLDSSAIRRKGSREGAIEYEYTPYQPAKQAWESAGLQSSGAYTRGLSFGNSQNLVFNSNLNLQLNGKLGNDLELQAALSDNSVPLQPDGTTRQLQEFDRIFIQIKRRNTALAAGDYDLTAPRGHFSQYFKRLQGGMVQGRQYGFRPPWQKVNTATLLPTRDTLGYRVAAAVSRGKFARQNILGIEGNQGPYRLQGAEGERFIIVLAGTEKVYMDGLLLQRGLDADYTIDYNLGEVSFTPRRLMTKDKRVIVEFEYAVQNYLRSTLAANWTWDRPNARFYANFYAEQDSRKPSSAQDLSEAERSTLGQAGDQLQRAYASGIDTLDAFDNGRIMYKSVDTLVCGQLINVLTYSANADSARYTARFTEVPFGQGNYVLQSSAANGRVFKWIAPDPANCQPRGNFEPVVRLIAPEKRQLLSVGAQIKPLKKTSLQLETALSNRDYNRFSPLDEQDNQGLAFMGTWSQLFALGKGREGGFQANYERTEKNFRPLNPYRPAEFSRDWNSETSRDTVAEQLARARLWIARNRNFRLSYDLNSFARQGVYQGLKQLGQYNGQWKGFELMTEVNQLNSEGKIESSRFSRPKAELSYRFVPRDSAIKSAWFKLGFYVEREKNERRNPGGDSLRASSFWYDLYRFYWQMPDETRAFSLGGYLQVRDDYAPEGADFTQSTTAREFNIEGRWDNALRKRTVRPTTNQRLNWNFNLRKLKILAPELIQVEAQNTYLGRVDYTFAAFKNALNLGTGYELGSGQSPKVEFNYLKVNPGEGQYAWIDRNRDSILQVDEMEIAVFQDQAAYLRVAVTTAEYIRTNNLIFSQNIRFEPRLLWPNPRQTYKKLLKRFSTQSSVQLNRRSFAAAARTESWNPFAFGIPDSLLVTESSFIRNNLFINRADPVWDVSLAQNLSLSQFVLTSGYESRENRDWNAHGRINFSKKWSVECDALYAQKNSDNEAFNSRDFALKGIEAGPSLNWMPGRNFRIKTAASFKRNANSIGQLEKSTQYKAQQEITWNPPGKTNNKGFKPNTSIRSKIVFSDIRYTGAANTAVAFTMLEGLQNGRNYIWILNLDRQISKSLQLSLNYEGRKTGSGARIVHVGRAQVRAIL